MARPRKRVWQNSDGKESVRWEIRYTDARGNRRSKQFPTQKAALAWDQKRTVEMAAGRFIADRDTVTVAEAGRRWLDLCKVGRDGRDPVEPHTLRAYDSLFRTHIEPVLGTLRLNALTPLRVRDFRDHDLLGGGVSRSTAKKVLAALSAICNVAIADELLGVNPVKGVKLVTSSRHVERIQIPEKHQVRALLDRAAGWVETQPQFQARRGGVLKDAGARITRHRALWFSTLLRFLVATGCRPSEARGAAWADLDWHGCTYRVAQRADERGHIGSPKSAAGSRVIYLPPPLMADLERWRAVAPKTDLIFGNGRGKPEMLQNIHKRFWIPLMAECGFVRPGAGEGRPEPFFRLYDLRHFAASVMIEIGMQAKELQERMGHASIKMTLDTYGHLFKDDAALARHREMVASSAAGILDSGPALADAKSPQNGPVMDLSD